VQLVSEVAQIPVTINNPLTYDVSVRVEAFSDDPQFIVYSPGIVTIERFSELKLPLDVKAKANGRFILTVQMSALNYEYPPMQFEVNSRRNIGEGITYAVYVAIVLLIVLGIYRTTKKHLKTRQKKRAQALHELAQADSTTATTASDDALSPTESVV
jgi:hypothetical protein